MTDFEEKLAILAFDKLLFAVVVSLFVFLFARSIERLKNLLSWETEVAKHALAMSGRLASCLSKVSSTHEVAAFHALHGGSVEWKSFAALKAAVDEIDRAIDEARLVLTKPTIDLVKKARHSAFWFLDPGESDVDEPARNVLATGPSGVSVRALSRLKESREQVAETINAAIDAIQLDTNVHPRKLMSGR